METEDRKTLVLKVADYTNSDPDTLKAIIGTFHVLNIPTNSKPLAYANNVVHYCELSAWIEQPPLIIKLLDTWESFQEFMDIKSRIEQSGPPRFHSENDPWATCLLALQLPFLNREKTRKAIKLFINPLHPDNVLIDPGARVLVVNGPPKSGKSFTFDYIKYIGTILTKNNCDIAFVDCSKQLSSRFGAVELMKSILLQINQDWDESSIPEFGTQQSARWIIELVKFFIKKVAASQITWFIVIDGLSAQTAPTETIEFIQRLANTITGKDNVDLNIEKNETPIRLILLDFKWPVSNFKDRVITDDITDIQEKAISKYFEHYAAYKQKPISAADLKSIVGIVMRQISIYDKDPNRTKIIADLVLKIADSLFSPK